jgi:hypothetical protein
MNLSLYVSIYLGIESRHRRKSIEYETTSMSVVDIQTYYDALGMYLCVYVSMCLCILLFYLIRLTLILMYQSMHLCVYASIYL